MKKNKLKTQKHNKVLKKTFLKENNKKLNIKNFSKARYKQIITNHRLLLRIALLKKT